MDEHTSKQALREFLFGGDYSSNPFADQLFEWVIWFKGVKDGWECNIPLIWEVSEHDALVFVSFDDSETKYVLFVNQDEAIIVLTFDGVFGAVHYSRSKKSIVLHTEQNRYLNGDPYIDYYSKKYTFALNGKMRD